MLLIIMHNNQDYLKYLAQLAIKEDIKDFTFIKQVGMGSRLLGGDNSFIYQRGSKIDAYEKAFVAVVKDEEKTRHFIERIGDDDHLDLLNMRDKGFICALPLRCVKNCELKLSCADDKKALLARRP